MSDPKRAALITVGAPKSAKKNVTKTVRLTINLDESNESKYPALNYKELVIVEERKKKTENGKTPGLDPFSDNDDDVEQIAKKFEQKYGGKSTYGKKGRSKRDDFVDIGAGYDKNDSFIDDTHGYDEMILPHRDTYYGGFYINSGSLELISRPDDQGPMSDAEAAGARRNKRRISSSSSEEDSSESSSESESHDEKETGPATNGDVDSHKTEHRKKKNKKNEKNQAKRMKRTDSSAATSGKQTSDENAPVHSESADSRTSQSDSLTSKPAPSSENAVTSDSSRDAADAKTDPLPPPVLLILDEMKNRVPLTINSAEPYIIRLHHALTPFDRRVLKAAWMRAARIVKTTRTKLMERAKQLVEPNHNNNQPKPPPSQLTNTVPPYYPTTSKVAQSPPLDRELQGLDVDKLTPAAREQKIVAMLDRLKKLIEEKKPAMIANYKSECERVQEERKKMQQAASDGAPYIEKRMPKRRFPWCTKSRNLLCALSKLGAPAAASLLASRALPLFPKGFVRLPTLLRQSDIKTKENKRQPMKPTPHPASVPNTAEPVSFPSSVIITAVKSEANVTEEAKDRVDSREPKKDNPKFDLGPISFSLGKDIIVEKQDDKPKDTLTIEKVNDKPKKDTISIEKINDKHKSKEVTVEKVNEKPKKDTVSIGKLNDKHKSKEMSVDKGNDKYVPPNNIGSITITPVNNAQKDKVKKQVNNSVIIFEKPVAIQPAESFIRVKSPAVLAKEADELAKKEKKKSDKPQPKEKRVNSPLHIDISYQNKKEPTPSPKSELSNKHIEAIRCEDKIPRPALIPVHLSPTFAKPDKRPQDSKKKKDIEIISDLDPLDMNSEPLAIDDSSSDVEVIEDKKSEVEMSVVTDKSDLVPSNKSVLRKDDLAAKERDRHKTKVGVRGDSMEVDEVEADFDTVMRNLREMQDSQEQTFSNNSYPGVITSAQNEIL